MSTHTSFAIAAGVSLLIAASLACSGRPEPPAADTRPPVRVRSATIAMSDLDDGFEAGGIVQARTTAAVTSRILAPVLAVRAAAGDRVRSGQVLVVLDGRDFGARARSATAAATAARQRVTAAEADARAANASVVLAKATHDRIQLLHSRRSATPQELDEATATLRAAEARAEGAAARLEESTAAVAGAQAESEAASTTESFTQIAAPFDGVVTETLVEAGNMAAPGTPLIRLEDTRGFRLEVRVDESRAGGVTMGASVPVTLGARGTDTPAPLSGTVSEVARAVDSDARTFTVKIALPAMDGLRSGMFGRARFPAATRRALTVPPEAVVRNGQVTSAFVIAGGVARLTLINVAGGEVLAGLSDGDRVILDPSPDIVDGRRISEGARQ